MKVWSTQEDLLVTCDGGNDLEMACRIVKFKVSIR